MSSLFSNIELPSSPVVEAEDDDAQSVSGESTRSELHLDSTTTPATEPEFSETTKLDKEKNDEKDILPENPFDSAASRALFDAIDQFQSCGAGEFVDIPQLVIVGAQSVGKSSLLQSLTDIPFPVGEDCCTRFATRIVSRRTAPNTASKIRISIVPPDFTMKHFNYSKNNSLKDFDKVAQSLTASEFATIIEEASEKYMGLRPGKGRGSKNFATEVLKIEISGPGRSHFSILDIPGIFVNDYNVCDGEMEGVRRMVTEYMKRPDNIVICVADACVDLANQEIFKLANSHVDKTRLIGVFTKCDRTNNLTSVVDVATGKVRGVAPLLHHGWFVVRNKTKKDDAEVGFDLASAERALFDQHPWSAIRESRRGSSMLKKYLGKLLCHMIQAAFPVLLDNLRAQLKTARAAERSLGPARDSTHQRRAYLTDLAQRYLASAKEALERPWLLESSPLRARQFVRSENESFSDKMRESGHMYPFQGHGRGVEDCLRRLRTILKLKSPADATGEDDDGSSAEEGGGAEEPESEEIFGKIKEEVGICSSTQLPGMVHPDVIQRLYKLQTALWHDMAADHVRKTAAAMLETAGLLLRSVCPAAGSTAFLHGELWLAVMQFHDESLERALGELRRFCRGDQNKLLQTTDPGFNRRLQLLRSLRMVQAMEVAPHFVLLNKETHSAEELGLLLFDEFHPSAINNTVMDVHDTLKVYYESSLQSFIRYVTNTIVEDFVTDVSGTLYGFSPNYIYSLDASEVDRLGSENRDVVEERELLRSRIETLLSVEKTARTAMATASQ